MATDKLPSACQAAILDIILNGEKPGLDIRHEYESRTKRNLPLGSLYTTLSRMESDGFVTSRTGDGTGDGTKERRGYPRKFFKVTGTGESALKDYQLFIMNAFEVEF